ncbi:Rv1733c family protein [Lentzea flava]|uniref:Transmembrane protein n=1 Tax=Lentzea flava TaxID=103732 RepID=A0ABQ2URR7_9PSEU|nr:hypothetical protein [Lentzea flava]MCP2197240.1 hypothetical protein [Lentzea flava]GGU50513.1 hypothetical protein GCM10010178_49120 [Lentzea flava]
MTAKPMTRLVHQAFPYRNKLATTGDRIEGAVLAAGVAVALLAVPVVAATGSEVYATHRAQVAVEQASRHHVDAVLIEDAPPTIGSTERGGVVESTPVLARWRLPDGSAREGVVQAHYDAKAGAKVPVWIDRNGAVTVPPMTNEGAAINAILLALLLWGGTAGSMTLLYLAVRFAHQRIRERRWGTEWLRIAPEWTGR